MNLVKIRRLFQKCVRRIFLRRLQATTKAAAASQLPSSKMRESTSRASSIKTEVASSAFSGAKDADLKPSLSPPKKTSDRPGNIHALLPMPTIPASEIHELYEQRQDDTGDRKWLHELSEVRFVDAIKASKYGLESHETLKQTISTITLQEENELTPKIPAITLTAAEDSQPTMDACTWIVLGMKTWEPVDIHITVRPQVSRKDSRKKEKKAEAPKPGYKFIRLRDI